MTDWHVAQLNVGKLRHPIDADETADFVAKLDPVNAVADAAPGFVWRLQDDSGNATSVRADDDPLVIVNLSVWESVEALEAFVRGAQHVAVLRRRGEWFEKISAAYLVLWWIPAGRRPTTGEAMDRLAYLRAHGATPTAFTFRERFAPDAADLST
jgi:heme-degrading monooxygenase HmoA